MAVADGEEDVVVQWQRESPDDGEPWTAMSLNNNVSRKVNLQAKELFGKLNNLPVESFNHHLERAAGATMFPDQADYNSQTDIEPVVLNVDDNLSPPSSDEHNAQSHTKATMISC